MAALVRKIIADLHALEFREYCNRVPRATMHGVGWYVSAANPAWRVAVLERNYVFVDIILSESITVHAHYLEEDQIVKVFTMEEDDSAWQTFLEEIRSLIVQINDRA